MDERQKRIGTHSIDAEFEKVLGETNTALSGIDSKLYMHDGEMAPLVFICFAPRSGSSVLAQYLAATNRFNYFSGFNARYWKSPVFSQLLEKKLGIRDHILKSGVDSLKSIYGYSDNPSMPHEFGFFWNQLLTDDHHLIDISKVDEQVKSNFVNTLNTCRRLSDKPFFVKNGISAYNVPMLKELFPGALFLHLEREAEFVIQSIYQARLELYNDPNSWWSLVPANQLNIIREATNPFEEIAQQIRAINDQIDQVDTLKISYQEFCQAPQKILVQIFNWLEIEPLRNINIVKPTYQNKVYLTRAEFEQVNAAKQKYLEHK